MAELQGKAQQRLEPDDAGLGLREGQALALLVLGRVVGGDGVDRAVFYALDDGLAVRLGAPGRGEFGEGAVLADRRFVEGEIGRRGVASHRQAAGLGPAHRVHGQRRGQMRRVIPRARELDEADVALDHEDLGDGGDALEAETGRDLSLVHEPARGEARLFRVLDDQQVEGLGVAQGPAHHQGIGDRLGGVGERHGAGRGEQAHLGHALAPEPLGEGAVRVDVDEAGFAPARDHELDQGGVVDHRLGVGQTRHGGDPAGRGREARRHHGFLVFLAGLAQLHPHVHEARGEAVPAAIDGLDALGDAVGEQTGAEIGDRRAFGEQRAGAVEAARRVQKPGVHISRAGRGRRVRRLGCRPTRAGSRGRFLGGDLRGLVHGVRHGAAASAERFCVTASRQAMRTATPDST